VKHCTAQQNNPVGAGKYSPHLNRAIIFLQGEFKMEIESAKLIAQAISHGLGAIVNSMFVIGIIAIISYICVNNKHEK